MDKVKILPESVINKIAAGEIVESPASVIKELIENSIDAGSRVITVDLKQGGKKQIQVSDNGEGMSRNDAILALERHSTSKISRAEDLSAIATLGFRGEALPSIAAVSKLTIITRQSDMVNGWKIDVQGGVIKQVEETGSPPGTIIRVKDLFFNTPVRKKFLKSVEFELRRIRELAARYILAYPEIAFRFTHNNRELFSSSGRNDSRECLMCVWGKDVAVNMLEISPDKETAGARKVRGFLARAFINRSGPQDLLIFVNRRPVRSRLVQDAVVDAYHTYFAPKRYPVAVISLQLPPEDFDPNVHPAKYEVRFKDEARLFSLIRDTCRRTLERAKHVPEVSVSALEKQTKKPRDEIDVVEQPLLWTKKPASKKTFFGFPGFKEPLPAEKTAENEDNIIHLKKKKLLKIKAGLETKNLKFVGQLFGTYLILESGEEVFVVDQHAAHERIMYEKLMRSCGEEKLASQTLLFPVVIELNAADVPLLHKQKYKLDRMGIILEHFGGTSFIVKALPVLLGKVDDKRIARELVNELLHFLYVKSIEELKEKLVMIAACRQAIKAGDPLNAETVQVLLEDLLNTRNPYTCPHGRPTLLSVRKLDIEKEFKRT